MADNKEDRYAFIIDDCLYSYSQEDLLICSNFARVDDTISGDVPGKNTPPADNYGVNLCESIVGSVSGRNCGGGNENDIGNLGFRGEIKESKKGNSPLMNCSGKVVIEGEIDGSEVVFEGDLKVKLVRPLRCVAIDGGVECSEGKLGFEDGGEGSVKNRMKKKLEFEVGEENVVENEENVDTEVIEVGDDKENVAKNEGVGYVDTEVIEIVEEGGTSKREEVVGNVDMEVVGGDGEEEEEDCAEVDGETRDVEMEEIVVGQEEGKVDGGTSNVGKEEIVVGEEEGKVDGGTSNVGKAEIVVGEEGENCEKIGGEMNNISKEDENGKSRVDKEGGEGSGKRDENVLQEGMKGRKKRKLPRSMFEQWGEEIRNGEGCSKDASLEGNGNGNEKSKDDEVPIRCILDAVKFLVREKCYGGDEVDFFETAKRLGMTFPPPRFRSAIEEGA